MVREILPIVNLQAVPMKAVPAYARVCKKKKRHIRRTWVCWNNFY